MNKFMKKMGAVTLAATVAVSGIAYSPATTKAEEEYNDILTQSGTAVANTDVSYEFAVSAEAPLYVDIVASKPVAGMVSFYVNNSEWNTVPLTNDQNTWVYAESIGAYVTGWTFNPVAADYRVVLNFNEDVDYMLDIYQGKSASTAVISSNSIVLTNGFSQTLTVSGGEVASWSSSDKSIATVDSNGKVTGKKAGSAKISATMSDGSVLTCAVSVKKNEYSETKGYASQVPYGESVVQVYKMSYNSKGNLVLKVRIINNRGYKATKIKKLSITVKNDAGKTVGTYTVKNKAVSINSGSTKDLTYTIKKKDLKIKKADLRTSTYTTPGTLVYTVPR